MTWFFPKLVPFSLLQLAQPLMDSTDSEKRASFTANKWMYEHLKQAPISEVSGMPVPDFMLEFGFCSFFIRIT